MPAPRVLPPTSELRRMVENGMTQTQIAEAISQQTGQKISRSAVSVALHRAGLTETKARYKDTLPWRVRKEHLPAYPARMLRLLGKVRDGGALSEDEEKRLASWMKQLDGNGLVVAYSPVAGFLYVDGDEVGDYPDDIPIRPRTIGEDELPEELLGHV